MEQETIRNAARRWEITRSAFKERLPSTWKPQTQHCRERNGKWAGLIAAQAPLSKAGWRRKAKKDNRKQEPLSLPGMREDHLSFKLNWRESGGIEGKLL